MELTKKSYVPVLKWKRAEHGALSELGDSAKDTTIPLIELVMPKPKNSLKDTSIDDLYNEVIRIFNTKKLQEIPGEILSVWGSRPIFVDFSLLYPEVKLTALKYVTSEATKLDLNIIPVVNFGDDNEFKAAIIYAHKILKDDICIRISTTDLENITELNIRLTNYLKLSAVDESCTYLIVDLKDTTEIGDYNDYKRIVDASQQILNLPKWKGFILSAGSFPMDLSECKIDQDNFLPRDDWAYWKKQYGRIDLTRIPTFSDYGIRHSIYIESYQFREPTASVKYTLEDSWWVVKGKKREYKYFLGAAALLSGDSNYYGEAFSSGDKYIAEKALHYIEYSKDPTIKGTGTTELWLKAGLNHHLSVVSAQLSSLV
ncbi:MAG: beta family protein [Candidatus Saccharimonadia bacterium]